ncbi:hypothetical protein Tco_0455452 [Tanacetum coccineum]
MSTSSLHAEKTVYTSLTLFSDTKLNVEITQDNYNRDLILRRREERSLITIHFLANTNVLLLHLIERRDEKKRLDNLKQDQTILVIKRFSERKNVLERERRWKNSCKEVCFSARNSVIFVDRNPNGHLQTVPPVPDISGGRPVDSAPVFVFLWGMLKGGDEKLWCKVIRSVHGIDGALGRGIIISSRGCGVWYDIIKVGRILEEIGIEFTSSLVKKVGNEKERRMYWCREGFIGLKGNGDGYGIGVENREVGERVNG